MANAARLPEPLPRESRLPARAFGHRPVEHISVSVPLDPYISLQALASYSGLSVRKLRDYLDDATHPLPCYRPGGKVLVRVSEFDEWISKYRVRGRADVDRIVSATLRDLM